MDFVIIVYMCRYVSQCVSNCNFKKNRIKSARERKKKREKTSMVKYPSCRHYSHKWNMVATIQIKNI